MSLFAFDAEIASQSVGPICGIDEAGRGPLAGPVFAAAAVLPQGVTFEGLNDSKKLTEKRREALFEQITACCTYCIASATEQEIDELNILQATYLAMGRAYEGLVQRLGAAPGLVLVDGNGLPPGIGAPTRCVIGGDGKSAAIAAASILAKVSRDRYMLQLCEQYPQYAFEKHKGYGTKLHYERLAEYGLSPLHRRSFLKKLTGVV